MVEAAGEEEQELAAQMAAAFLSENLPESVFGAPKAGPGMWASIVRVVNPITRTTVEKVHLEQNEAAHRLAIISILALSDEFPFCYKTSNPSNLPNISIHLL